MQTLRTPDDRFDDLPDFSYAPNYCEVSDDDGGALRVAWVQDGPDWTWVMSRTRMPSSALAVMGVSPHLYMVWFMVPGAYASGSTQTLISDGLPDSRARCSAGAMSAGSRTSSP